MKNEKLYHYTSVRGFESIVKNKCIRITRSDFMNDPHDCRVFFDIVEKYINVVMSDINISKHLSNQDNLEYVSKVIKKYPPTEYMKYIYRTVPMYVFSLTSEIDSLPMWNYYGGDGIRLAFCSDKLISTMSKNLCKSHFDFLVKTKVEYISSDTKLENLTLNSFSDFYVYKYSKADKKVISRKHSLHHSEGDNLKFFIDSYIISYIKSIEFCAEREKSWLCPDDCTLLEEGDERFFREILNNNRLQDSATTKFKFDIDLYMLILASRYKIKTFENESETRIVFFRYDPYIQPDETIVTAEYKFGSFLKPVVECPFDSRDVSDILLAPSAKQIPVNIEMYKNVIRKLLRKNPEFNVNVSKHDVRW